LILQQLGLVSVPFCDYTQEDLKPGSANFIGVKRHEFVGSLSSTVPDCHCTADSVNLKCRASLAHAIFPSASCTNDQERDFIGNTSEVFSVAFSSDGKYALTGSNDWTARLWNVRTGREVRTFAGHTGGVTSIAFSPDGRYLLTGSIDRTARLWNIRSGKEVRTFSGSAVMLFGVAFSPDGKYVVAASGDKTPGCGMHTAQLIAILLDTLPVTSVAFRRMARMFSRVAAMRRAPVDAIPELLLHLQIIFRRYALPSLDG
jgi:WD40 repeat protein